MHEASAKMVAPPPLFRLSFATTRIPGENSATAQIRIELGADSSATIAQTTSYTFAKSRISTLNQGFSNKAPQPGDFHEFNIQIWRIRIGYRSKIAPAARIGRVTPNS